MEEVREAEAVRPVAVDLFSGLGGWTEGLVKAGWYVIRFDLEDMCKLLGEPHPEHSSLVLQDVLTIHGSQLKSARLIVSSSPCQDFSYRAMPFKRAKAKHAPFLGMWLYHAQFRIQREACEAAGRYIPMICENVRGAVPWVGPSRANSGSMHFWGDVPALMPEHKHVKVQSFRFDGSGRSFQSSAVRQGWFNDQPRTPESLASMGSKSPARKAASARIAKIPVEISEWIGRCYFPQNREAA